MALSPPNRVRSSIKMPHNDHQGSHKGKFELTLLNFMVRIGFWPQDTVKY
jgi:hypothetical protein